MSTSSDLKLIRNMASRLFCDMADSPSGSIPFTSWVLWQDLLTKVASLDSRLNALEICLPADFESSALEQDGRPCHDHPTQYPPSMDGADGGSMLGSSDIRDTWNASLLADWADV